MLPEPTFTISEKVSSIFDKCEADVVSSAGFASTKDGGKSEDEVLKEKS